MRGCLVLTTFVTTILVGVSALAETPAAPILTAGSAAIQVIQDEAPLPLGAVSSACTFKGKKLFGKVQVVTAFPDIKVQVVSAFPDLKVQKVTAFPDSCGKWQMVTAFPDFKVQFVTAFPDVKIQYVTAFPGVR